MKYKIQFLFLIFFLLFVQIGLTQITFQKTYGGSGQDIGYCVQQTFDSGYVVSGSSYSYPLGYGNDGYILKTDKNGNIIWTRIIAKSYKMSNIPYIQQLSNGSYIAIDNIYSYSKNIFKLDSMGNVLWRRNVCYYLAEATSIGQTTDGGYYICGNTGSGGAPSVYDIYLIRTDSIGDTLWLKKYTGTGSAIGYSGIETNDKGFIMAGDIYVTGMGHNVYLIKTDSSGNVMWAKTYGGTNNDYGRYISQTKDGGYIICGYTYSFGAGLADIYVIKIDGNGTLLWSKTYGGINNDISTCIHQTLDGGFIIAGQTVNSFNNNSIYVIKTDINGFPLWSRTFSTNTDLPCTIQQTYDLGYIICGNVTNFMNGKDIYLIKTDSYGNSGCPQDTMATIMDTALTDTTSMIINTSTGATLYNTSFLYGSGGIITADCSMIGIEEIKTDNPFLIYPNPATGRVNTKLPQNFGKIKTLEVYNYIGQLQLVKTDSFSEINISSLKSGLYFIVLTNSNNRKLTSKLIKE